MVQPGAAPERGQNAHRHREHEPQEHPQDGQFERRRERLQDKRRDRLLVDVRGAEVAVRRVAQPLHVLHDQWSIQPEQLAHGGNRRWVGVLAEAHDRHVAWNNPEDEKDDGRDDEQDRHELSDATGDVAAHVVRCSPVDRIMKYCSAIRVRLGSGRLSCQPEPPVDPVRFDAIRVAIYWIPVHSSWRHPALLTGLSCTVPALRPASGRYLHGLLERC